MSMDATLQERNAIDPMEMSIRPAMTTRQTPLATMRSGVAVCRMAMKFARVRKLGAMNE